MGKVDFDNEQLHISDAEREALADVTDDELETETGDYDPEDVDSNIEDVDDTKGDAGDDEQDGADGTVPGQPPTGTATHPMTMLPTIRRQAPKTPPPPLPKIQNQPMTSRATRSSTRTRPFPPCLS